jgi:hypothetical protein
MSASASRPARTASRGPQRIPSGWHWRSWRPCRRPGRARDSCRPSLLVGEVLLDPSRVDVVEGDPLAARWMSRSAVRSHRRGRRRASPAGQRNPADVSAKRARRSSPARHRHRPHRRRPARRCLGEDAGMALTASPITVLAIFLRHVVGNVSRSPCGQVPLERENVRSEQSRRLQDARTAPKPLQQESTATAGVGVGLARFA